jgi:hypothetical protein
MHIGEEKGKEEGQRTGSGVRRIEMRKLGQSWREKDIEKKDRNEKRRALR